MPDYEFWVFETNLLQMNLQKVFDKYLLSPEGRRLFVKNGGKQIVFFNAAGTVTCDTFQLDVH